MSDLRKIIGLFTVIVCLIIGLESCEEESSEKSMNRFLFEAAKNPGLTQDVVAEIADDLITAVLPSGVNVSSLVATFLFTGSEVTANGRTQSSGVSSNDFSYPVEYIVVANDNSVRRYMVTVKVGYNTITAFEFRKSLNPGLSGDVTAMIRDDSIIAEFPGAIPTNNLIASYTTMAASVTVNGVRQINGFTPNNFSSPVEYVVEGIDGSKRTYKVALRESKNFTRFLIKKSLNPALDQDIEFAINHANLTMEGSYLRWIESDHPSQLTVSFESSGIKVELGGVLIESDKTVVDFKKPLQFTITPEDNTPRTYSATLICPQINATLPILRLEADGPILNKVDYVKAKLEIVGNGINQGLWDFNREKIEIRLRGNSTTYLPKRPYRIKFPEKYSPLGLNHANVRSWALLANDCDKSLIRNDVAFQISRIMQDGASYRQFTPCTRFVDLYLNGVYEGNYHLTDQVQVNPGRVEVQSLTASDAGNTSRITGGYLLELDGFAEGEPLWFMSPRGMKVSIKHPDDDDYAPEQVTWITNYFATVENALFSQDFKNPVTGWRKYINMASWVDYCIINEMAGNSDAWWQTFMSKERGIDFFVMGPVWDFDIAFNNDNRIFNATNRLMIEAAHDPKVWINRFMQDETFKAAIKTRWNEKKGELFLLTDYVDELASLLDMSQKANFKRWNISQQTLGHANPAPVSYPEAIRQLKYYLQERYKFLDNEFNKW